MTHQSDRVRFTTARSSLQRAGLLLAALTLSACKQPLEIIGEGDIIDLQGSTLGCTLEQFQAADPACTENDVTGFGEVAYQGIPRAGWRFVEWRGICKPDSLRELCMFDYALAGLLAGQVMPPITAVFEEIDTGNTDIIITSEDSDAITVVLTNTAGTRFMVADDYGVAPDQAVRDAFGGGDGYAYVFRGLPNDEHYRLFLITGGGIAPLGWDTDGDFVNDVNVFSLSDSNDCVSYQDAELRQIYLGRIWRDSLWNGSCQAPWTTIPPDSLVALDFQVELPSALEAPVTGTRTSEELILAGLSAMSVDWIAGAHDYFERATLQTEAGASNDADAARFYLAVARLAYAAAAGTISDGDASDRNRLGDLLDLMGAPNDARRGEPAVPRFGYAPDEFNFDQVSEDEVLDYFEQSYQRALADAVDLLAEVSPRFSQQRFRVRNRNVQEDDYADALLLLGLLKLEMSLGEIENAYSTKVDAEVMGDWVQNDVDITIESTLDANPELLRLVDQQSLQRSSAFLLESLAALEGAVMAIQAETDDQSDDLVNLASDGGNRAQEALDYLARVRNSIQNGPTEITSEQDPYSKRILILDLQAFFLGGVDFRGDGLLPEFNGNESDACLPDPTFNGVVLSPDLNEGAVEPPGSCP